MSGPFVNGNEFPMNAGTRDQIENWKRENTRASKRKANLLMNGAFKAFLHQECLNSTLCLALLKHPTAKVHTLLESWAAYVESPAYLNERKRARKVDGSNEELSNEKDRQLRPKMRVHKLRHLVRQAKWLSRHPERMTCENENVYRAWRASQLIIDLDTSTERHGYGKIHSTGKALAF